MSKDVVYALKKLVICMVPSSLWPKYQGPGGSESGPSTLINSLIEYLLFPCNFGFSGFGGLIFRGLFPPGNTDIKLIPLTWKLRLPLGHSGFLMRLSQWQKRGF